MIITLGPLDRCPIPFASEIIWGSLFKYFQEKLGENYILYFWMKKGQFRLMEIRMGLVVSRPFSIKSLNMAEGIAGKYIRVLSETSSDWVNFCNDVIFWEFQTELSRV